MRTIAIVPAYNESHTIAEVVTGLRGVVSGVLVVDDGSHDQTAKLAAAAGAEIIAHATNRGLGAALTTGIAAALSQGADIIITFDADAQMDPHDVPRLVAALVEVRPLPTTLEVSPRSTMVEAKLRPNRHCEEPKRLACRQAGEAIPHSSVIPSQVEGSRSLFPELVEGLPFADIAIGSRWLTSRRPITRWLANLTANFFTYLLFGVYSTDTQSGLRAFTRQAAEKLELHPHAPPGMEVSSEIFAEIARLKLRFVEIPVQPRYTHYSQSKGQNFFVGLATLGRLFLRRLTR